MRTFDSDAKTSILQSLYTFPYLTADRVCRLLFSPGSIQRVRQYLAALHAYGLVKRAPEFSQKRTKTHVYWLTASGRRKLRSLSDAYNFAGWQEPKPMENFLSSSQFAHHMAVTDVLIQFTLISTLYPDIRITQATHYYHLRLTPVAPVVPDGLIVIRLPPDKYLYFVLEVDLDTEKATRIKEKVSTWVEYIKTGAFGEQYAIREVPTIVFYTPTDRRCHELLMLIEEALQSIYEPSKASWFKVGSGMLLPETFFEEIWLMPQGLNERKVTSLLRFLNEGI